MSSPTAAPRPRRSVLYMPGSKARALEKARSLPADALILDLEDAVAPAEKLAARGMVAEAVRAGGFGPREVVIRINGLDTDWGADDLAAAVAAGPDAVLIPKVESAQTIHDVALRFERLGAQPHTRIWAMMETRWACSTPPDRGGAPAARLPGDGDERPREGPARAAHRPAPAGDHRAGPVPAGRARPRLAIVDGVYNAFRDAEGLRRACLQGREMGMDGKTLIHPDQLAVANEVFAPSDAEIAQARAYVEAFAAAEARGEGVAVVDGRIVENLHVAQARRLLTEAEAIDRLAAAAD